MTRGGAQTFGRSPVAIASSRFGPLIHRFACRLFLAAAVVFIVFLAVGPTAGDRWFAGGMAAVCSATAYLNYRLRHWFITRFAETVEMRRS